MKSINPKFEFISWALVIFVFILVIYYTVVLSWDMLYLGSSFSFSWGNDTAMYFSQYIGGSSNLANMATLLIPTAIGTILVWIIIWYISHKDVNSGIGKLSQILMPLLFVLMAIIIIYALLLPGAMLGVNNLLNPDWGMLLNVNVWLSAFSQIISL